MIWGLNGRPPKNMYAILALEVIGVGVQIGEGEPKWFSGTMRETKDWLGQFDWGNCMAVAHNAMFDMAILNWHFDISS